MFGGTMERKVAIGRNCTSYQIEELEWSDVIAAFGKLSPSKIIACTVHAAIAIKWCPIFPAEVCCNVTSLIPSIVGRKFVLSLQAVTPLLSQVSDRKFSGVLITLLTCRLLPSFPGVCWASFRLLHLILAMEPLTMFYVERILHVRDIIVKERYFVLFSFFEGSLICVLIG